MFKRCFYLFCLLLLSTASPVYAINYAAGAKLPEGLVLNLYPYWYNANTRTDKSGSAITNTLGLHKYGMNVGANYYTGNWLFNVVVPTGSQEVHSLNSKDSGLGDIQARIGYFLPVQSVTILPIFFVKTPTGSFDRNHAVNFGDGQADVATEVYINKLSGSLSLDAVFKYLIRFRNPDSDITPGNEFATEMLATWRFTENLRIGPAFNFSIGEDSKRAGNIIGDSGLMKLAMGGEMYYRFPRVKLSLAAYQDILTRNTTQGLMLLGRIAIPFN